MKHYLKILVIPFLSITIGFGQIIDVSDLYTSNDYFFPNFEHIGEEANLPHYRISSLVEDHEGYLWIGTKDGGVLKYDGHEFESFEMNPSDPFSLTSNDIFFVFEDSRDMLWVGTDNGLCYYHPTLRKLVKVKLFKSFDAQLVPRNITCITEANNGNLLLGTNIGIFEVSNIRASNFIEQLHPNVCYDSVGININKILLQPEDPLVAGMIIRDIKYSPKGFLWILSENEIGVINYKKIINNMPVGRTNLKIDGDYQYVVSTEEGSKIFIDSAGIIWVNTLSQLFRITNNVSSFDVDKIVCDSNSSNIKELLNNSNSGTKFWIGHYGRNIMLFDEESQKKYPLTSEINNLNTLHDNGISVFLRTSSNVIFIGTAWGGLYKFNPNTVLSSFNPKLQAIYQNQTDNLRYVYEDSKGYLWLIARDIYRCDPYTGEVVATYNDEFFEHKWGYTNILLEDSKGRFWIGMEGLGLAYLDIDDFGKKYSTESLSTSTKVIYGKTVTAMLEDDNGILWVGTIYRDLDSAKIYTELYKIALDGKFIDNYAITNCLLRNGNESDQFINQIYIENDIVWMATGYGLVRLSNEPLEIKIYNEPNVEIAIGDKRMLSVCPDPYVPDSLLWLGSASRGLLCFNITAENFCSKANKMQLPTNHIASILSDNNGNLWLGTDKGISKIVIDEKGGTISKVYNFTKSDGLITSDFTNYYGPNAVKTKRNSLIFTGPRGFQVIEPENYEDDINTPLINLTNFTINYNPADFGQTDSPLKVPISATDELKLPYDENTLGFEMTAPDFKSSNKLKYAYMLGNYDNEWVINNKRTIQYTKLPPGSYNLMIKVATKDGIWGDSVSVLTIKIGRPWWNSFFAYFIYVSIFIAIVWLVDKIQVNRHNMKASIKLNKVETEKLRELDIMKSKFFANISHEFKTPLTLIMNPVEDMLTKPDQNDSHESLLIVKRNAKRLQQYITEILELSKLDANRLRLGVRELDIVSFLKFQVASFESIAYQKNISIKIKTTTDQIICYLDPEKLNTIISNLISNAIKFTPDGGKIEMVLSGCVCNEFESCSKKEGCLIISVNDTGVGIAKEKIPYIFDRYYRSEQNTGDNESGTGLGLALVRELVTLHHGTINVVSEVNRFTKFQLHFPMGRYHVNDVEFVNPNRYNIEEDFDFKPMEVHQELTVESNEIPEISLKIVLVIEDNKDMRTLISRGLRREFKILLAKDGEEGIQMAIDTSPDLILCDIMMPKKDGFEVAKTLKTNEITSHIPIILLTARSEMSDKLTGLGVGADDYLIKPFFAKELKVRVNNLLKQRDKLRKKYSRLNILKLDKLPNKSIDQIFLEKAVSIIEVHLADENFGVQTLLDNLSISRTQLHRKLKALVNQSANELIQNIRLQKASEMLKSNSGTVAEICYKVGFASPPYFTRLFKQHFGHNPSEHSVS